MIQLPIEIGDTILAGRFKNKKITVREIGLDDFGLPTINGRGILKIRIPKLYVKENTMLKEAVTSSDLKKVDKIYRGSYYGLTPKRALERVLWAKQIYTLAAKEDERYLDRAREMSRIANSYKERLGIEERLNEGSAGSIPVKIKKEDDRYFIYVQYPDETEKCITNVGFETEDLALHGVTTKGYTLVNDKDEPKDNKFTELPNAMAQRSNDFKLSEGSIKTLKRLIVEVLSEVDVTDPKLESTINMLAELEQKLAAATAQLEALKKQLDIAGLERQYKTLVETELWGFLEELKRDEVRVVRTKTIVMTIKRFQTDDKLTYKYEGPFMKALTYVNQDVKFKMLADLKEVETISKVKPALSFTTNENAQTSNFVRRAFNWIKTKFSAFLTSTKTKGQKIDSDLAKLERVLNIT